jgi:hypothetical protein
MALQFNLSLGEGLRVRNQEINADDVRAGLNNEGAKFI